MKTTLVFFLVVTRPRTFVRVARIAVRGWRVLIFRGCDHLSDTTTAVERHSLPPGGYGPRDNAISLDYLRHVYMHYNAREILKRRMASVSLIYAQLEFATECNRIRECLAIVSNGRILERWM